MLKFISILIVLLFASLPLASQAEVGDGSDGVLMKDPGSELWRDIRQRENFLNGTTQVKGVDSGILINTQGDRWARFRVNDMAFYGSIWLLVFLLLPLLFFVFRGQVEVEGGLSGRMVKRFSDYERIVHWVLGMVFIFLALTGLILLLGRTLLIPLLGREFFALLASASKEGHNLFGPIFFASLIMMFFSFVKRNIYARGDLSWLLKAGGFFSKSHVTGGFFNMGEKTWYWIVILVGLVISVSGLILVFPNFGQGRIIMELSHVVHGIGALILIAVSLGHMYLGSVGTEGTSEGMKTGYVDINWAQAHHDRWAKSYHENNLIISAEEYTRLQGKPVKKEQEK